MSYARPLGWQPGETMFACSICGFPYRFPSEMVYADDRLFYCRRTCWQGKTKLTDERERATGKPRRDNEQPPGILGSVPDYWR